MEDGPSTARARADAAALRAFRASRHEAAQRSSSAEGFFMRHGLALDGAHAAALAAQAGAAAGRAQKEEGSLESAQQTFADLFPGVCANADGPRRELVHEDGVQVAASGAFVYFRPGVHIPGGPGSTEDGLCLRHGVSRRQACTFRLLKLENPDADPTIRFGDLVGMVPYAGNDSFPSALRCRRAIRVKLVCPGRHGPVYANDHVYFVGVSRKGAATWTLGTAAAQDRGGSLALCRIPISTGLESSPTCFTLHGEQEGVAAEPPGPGGGALELSVMVYNAWLMPQFWNVLPVLQFLGVPLSHGKFFRARQIPRALASKLRELGSGDQEPPVPDVVVLCETFCERAGPILKAGLKREFGLVFETPTGGTEPFVEARALVSSGLSVLSRYPIESARFVPYTKEWAGDEGLANKGFIYVRFRKAGAAVNLFASHLQAWEYPAAIRAREAQLERLRQEIQALDLDPCEPVIIAGDLNVCRVQNPDQYDKMLDILQAEETFQVKPNIMHEARRLANAQLRAKTPSHMGLFPEADTQPSLWHGADKTASVTPEDVPSAVFEVYSFDTVHNTLAMGGPSASTASGLLDYVLVSKSHRKPGEAETLVFRGTRSTNSFTFGGREHCDLSDHYPVFSRLRFREPALDNDP